MKEILLTASVLIGVIMVLRWLLRGKVSQKLLYAAWLLVALRLLVPFQFGQWSFSLNTLSQTVTEQSETWQQAEQILQAPVAGPTHEVLRQELIQQYQQQGLDTENPKVQAQLEAEIPKTAPTLSQIIKVGWLVGMAVMAFWFLLTNLSFHRKAAAGAVSVEADAPVSVRVSAGVPTPCLVGLFRPVIYVTPNCLEDPQMLRHVLTHEIAHLRQWDPLWSLVRCVCLCVYWFHPLVWLAAAQSRRDCELACDESALKQLGDEERVAYGKTLLAMIRASSTPNQLLKTATSMNESKKQLRERMCFIVKKPRNLLIAAIAMVLIIALAAGCAFTGGKLPEKTPPKTEPTTETTIPPTTEPSTLPQTDPTVPNIAPPDILNNVPPMQSDAPTEAQRIAKDAIDRYLWYRIEGVCCDYELVAADLSQYLTEAQKEEYHGQQYKLTCCRNAKQVREHIDRCLSKELQEYGYPDSDLFTDGDGNLYVIILPTGYNGYGHIEVISQTKEQIVVRACSIDEDECYRNTVFTLRSTDQGYQVTNVEEDKTYRCEPVVVDRRPGYQVLQYGSYYDYHLYDSKGDLRIRHTTGFYRPTVTPITDRIMEVAIYYGPGIIHRTYWDVEDLRRSETYDYAIATNGKQIAYLEGELEQRVLVVCDIFDRSKTETFENLGFALKPMPVSEAAFTAEGTCLTLTYYLDENTETTMSWVRHAWG